MALPMFQNEMREVLRKLTGSPSPEERDQLLEKLSAAPSVKARDVMWMLFRPDRTYREAAARILERAADPDSVDAFVAEMKSKPEAAIRAAAGVLFALRLTGKEARVAQLAGAEDAETQENARRLLAEAPVTSAIEPILWQLATTGRPENRPLFLTRLAMLPFNEKSLPRWEKLARDPSKQVRERALELLAANAPQSAAGVLIEQLPHAGYTSQQAIVDALTRAAAAEGVAFADRVLPLTASGDAATRSAVLRILLAIPDRQAVVRRYIAFSKTLAGWARDRALDSMREFGPDLLEPIIELLADPDDQIRASAVAIAGSFDDPRIVPAVIPLLRDPDWWIRMTAVDTLGRLRDQRGVQPLIDALADPEVKWSAVEALGRIGDLRALPALGKLLGDASPDVRIEVVQTLRHFQHPQVLDAIRKVAASDPSRAVRARALDVAQEIADRDHKALADADSLRASALEVRSTQGEPRLHTMLIATRNQGASDLHISVGLPPTVRLAADLLRAQSPAFTAEQTEAMLREILTEEQWDRLSTSQQLDLCYYIPQAGRYRANIFLDQKGYNGVFRVIPEKPPTIAEIGLPSHLAEIADYHQGLVIVCGPSGSGKSTTLAALVNLFNETRHDHIITMEDPVEFVHPFKNCLVNQREIGTHSTSFARALRAALREDPDVIVIGELRDNEAVSLALTAAETGHIVLGTLSSTTAPKAVDRIISSFPSDEQPQIRTGLSESLKFVIAQRLLPAREGRRQVAAFEVLKGTPSVANMIRDSKTFQIPSAMQIGRSQGMQTFDDALRDLVKSGQISPETAYLAATRKEEFEPLVSEEFLQSGAYM